jgi:hypothetical protein
MREQEMHSWRVEVRVSRAVESVPSETDTERTPDEPVGEGVLREVSEEPTSQHSACTADSLMTSVPRECGRTE